MALRCAQDPATDGRHYELLRRPKQRGAESRRRTLERINAANRSKKSGWNPEDDGIRSAGIRKNVIRTFRNCR